MNQLRKLIAGVNATDATTLILGESGTGKELVSRALHEQSNRRAGPFIPVNMAALPRELVESALFGHEKGAFTGANQVRVGCCEAADGGTLFLDGDRLRWVWTFRPSCCSFTPGSHLSALGSSTTRTVDVRIVAATNRDLAELVREGRFREDLYYRLNVVPIEAPPLRTRREDVALLAQRFLERAALRHRKGVAGFDADALAALTRYDWPGNVRQLENLVEQLVIFAQGIEIVSTDLPPEIRAAVLPSLPLSPSAHAPTGPDVIVRIDEVEKRAGCFMHSARRRARSAKRRNSSAWAEATIYRKIKRYGIRSHDYACAAS